MTKLNLITVRLLLEINFTGQEESGLKTYMKLKLFNVGEEWKHP